MQYEQFFIYRSYDPGHLLEFLQPKEYETRVEVILKFPEMKIIEETVFIKEVYYEERTITVPRTKVIMEENVVIDKVPVIRQVPKTRIEIVHR